MNGEKRHIETKNHTMWVGNVRNLSFQDQLKATAAVGLNEMSMTPLDVDRNRAKGILPAGHADDGCGRGHKPSNPRSDG